MKFFLLILSLLFIFPIVTMCGDSAQNLSEESLYSQNVESIVSEKECLYIGVRNCRGSLECEQTCDQLYSQTRHKEKCYRLSSELVTEFQSIVSLVGQGEVDLDLEILECLLDIHEEPVVQAIGSLSKSEAQNFLAQITKDFSLSRLLKKEDRNGDVLKALFEEVGYRSVREVLKEPYINFNFLYELSRVDNENAFEYLDRYVEDKCSSCSNPIRLYCQGFLDWEKENLNYFLNQSEVFLENYSKYVLDQNYAYGLEITEGSQKGNFIDYCSLRASSIYSHASCPEAGISINKDYLLGILKVDAEGVYVSSLFDKVEEGSPQPNSQSEDKNLNLKTSEEGSEGGVTESLQLLTSQTPKDILEESIEELQNIVMKMVSENQKIYAWLDIENPSESPFILYLQKGEVVHKLLLTSVEDETTSYKKYEASVEKNVLLPNEEMYVYLAQSHDGECVFKTPY